MIVVTSTRGVRLVMLNMLLRIGVRAMIGHGGEAGGKRRDQIVNHDEPLGEQRGQDAEHVFRT